MIDHSKSTLHCISNIGGEEVKIYRQRINPKYRKLGFGENVYIKDKYVFGEMSKLAKDNSLVISMMTQKCRPKITFRCFLNSIDAQMIKEKRNRRFQQQQESNEEKPMHTVTTDSINAIINLAELTGGAKDDLTDMVVDLPDELQAAIDEEIKETRKETTRAAAKSIVAIIQEAKKRISDEVVQIRALRNEEKKRLAKIKKINAAIEKGNATKNFLPLVVELGIIDNAALARVVSDIDLLS